MVSLIFALFFHFLLFVRVIVGIGRRQVTSFTCLKALVTKKYQENDTLYLGQFEKAQTDFPRSAPKIQVGLTPKQTVVPYIVCTSTFPGGRPVSANLNRMKLAP